MSVAVFKFGGASIKDIERIKNVAEILKSHKDLKLVVVMSALGKTTNALESILNHYINQDIELCKAELYMLQQKHMDVASELLEGELLNTTLKDINDLIVEIDWIIEEEPQDEFDYTYDQLVSMGEFLSTKIVYRYLQSLGMKINWLDVRDMIKTDNRYRDANVDWDQSTSRIKTKIAEEFEKNDVLITQGFIGCSSENFTTTLGREGSDYTAAIFSYALDVKQLVIWKDVEGILTGDPNKLDGVTLIPELSFKESIEMSYYGAKVLHPKTIKPLQNKSIPLRVRSFLNLESQGTVISDNQIVAYPPITVIEENQILLHITTRDFSFVAENHLSEIFETCKKFRVKIRLMRNSALSFTMSINHPGKNLDGFLDALRESLDVNILDNLVLITIRSYDEEVIFERVAGRKIVFTEKYKKTIQLLVES